MEMARESSTCGCFRFWKCQFVFCSRPGKWRRLSSRSRSFLRRAKDSSSTGVAGDLGFSFLHADEYEDVELGLAPLLTATTKSSLVSRSSSHFAWYFRILSRNSG